MFEGLFQPTHLLVSLVLFLLCFGGPIWFAVYVVTSLKQIGVSLQRIADTLQTKT